MAVDLRPFQRFTLAFDGFAVHPDLVCRLADGESLVAVEAKGGSDLLRGIAQAELYRRGFHLVLLASAGRPPAELLALARQRAVGVLAVLPDRVELLDLPPAHMPQLRHAERIRRQLALNVALVSPFYFNLPTHYGDTLYATLIFFLAALLWPRWPTWRLAAVALSFCYAIELSQLFQAPWLDALRRTLPGRLVQTLRVSFANGAGFRWDDLLCYAAGVLLAVAVDPLWLRAGGAGRSNGRRSDGSIEHHSGRHHDADG